jgi:hypothetical protein
MLCTKCGELVRPVVAIDIDGTLGDFHTHFLTFLDGYIGSGARGMYAYDGSEEFKPWAMDVFGIDDATWRAAKLAYRQGGMKRTMPRFHEADLLINECRDMGAEVWLTTTRPYLRLDGIDPDTREWCRRNGIEFDGLLYDEEKYARLAERVSPERVVAVLDDLLEQVNAAREAFGEGVPILRRTSYNAAVPWDGEEVESLYAASRIIASRIDAWHSSEPGDNLLEADSTYKPRRSRA